MAANRDVNLPFPVRGINVAEGFQSQPPGTTPVGVNVRATEPLTQRVRGGSRSGLSKYIRERIPEGPVLIQHLTYIVDPQADALGLAGITPGDDWVEDPRNPGFFVPPGGWGWQPNPNASQPLGPGESGGSGSVIGVGSFEGDGETPGAGFGDVVHLEVTYQPAFSDLEVAPGTESNQTCECCLTGGNFDGNSFEYANMATEADFLQWLIDNSYIGEGPSTGDVIASFNIVVDESGTCECS